MVAATAEAALGTLDNSSVSESPDDESSFSSIAAMSLPAIFSLFLSVCLSVWTMWVDGCLLSKDRRSDIVEIMRLLFGVWRCHRRLRPIAASHVCVARGDDQTETIVVAPLIQKHPLIREKENGELCIFLYSYDCSSFALTWE